MELFAQDHVLGVVDAADQADAFAALAAAAVKLGVATDATAVSADLAERELEATTGFGGGVAIPHSKTDNVSKATVLFARLATPLEWNSLDGEPVTTLISILVPKDGSDVHLQILAKLARQLMHEDFVGVLRSGSLEDAYARIKEVVG